MVRVKICTGKYTEIIKSEIEYDGDYLQGTFDIRIVANSFDNIVSENFPDCYGDFVQEIPPELVIKKLVPKMRNHMKEYLKLAHRFTDKDLENLVIEFKDNR